MTPGWWGVCGRRLRFGGRCDPALDHDRRRRRGAGPVVVPDRASWTGGGCGAGEGWGLGGWPSRQPSPAKPDPSRLKGGGVPPPASAHWSSLLGHQCFGPHPWGFHSVRSHGILSLLETTRNSRAVQPPSAPASRRGFCVWGLCKFCGLTFARKVVAGN